MGLPTSRKEAIKAGSKYYFDGKICLRGHCSQRLTLTRNCMDCMRERTKASYWASREENLAINAEWRLKNKDRHRANAKRWSQKNIDKRREIARKWAVTHRQERRAYSSYACALRHKRMKNRTPAWVDKKELLSVYEIAQRLSAKTGIKYHVDHIVPISGVNVSGLHVPWNLRVISATENVRKYNRFIED